jgi:hypothetical protein
METRIITVISTKNNSKIVIESNANTLGDFKKDLRKANIDYSDMTFYEGLTKTELINDESLLPRNVEYKGTVTNNLVFMLTNTNKKIKSGITQDRVRIITQIKEFNLQDTVKARFSKNFTNCKTSDLEAIILEYLNTLNNPSNEVTDCPTNCDTPSTLQKLVRLLYNKHVITDKERISLFDNTTTYSDIDKLTEGYYSQKELEELFSFVD